MCIPQSICVLFALFQVYILILIIMYVLELNVLYFYIISSVCKVPCLTQKCLCFHKYDIFVQILNPNSNLSITVLITDSHSDYVNT